MFTFYFPFIISFAFFFIPFYFPFYVSLSHGLLTKGKAPSKRSSKSLTPCTLTSFSLIVFLQLRASVPSDTTGRMTRTACSLGPPSVTLVTAGWPLWWGQPWCRSRRPCGLPAGRLASAAHAGSRPSTEREEEPGGRPSRASGQGGSLFLSHPPDRGKSVAVCHG